MQFVEPFGDPLKVVSEPISNEQRFAVHTLDNVLKRIQFPLMD